MFDKSNARAMGKLGGRPKGSAYVALCQEWSEKKGGSWDILFSWAEGKENGKPVSAKLRRFAVQTILAYGYGRPRESVDLTSNGQSIADILAGALLRRNGVGATPNGMGSSGVVSEGDIGN